MFVRKDAAAHAGEFRPGARRRMARSRRAARLFEPQKAAKHSRRSTAAAAAAHATMRSRCSDRRGNANPQPASRRRRTAHETRRARRTTRRHRLRGCPARPPCAGTARARRTARRGLRHPAPPSAFVAVFCPAAPLPIPGPAGDSLNCVAGYCHTTHIYGARPPSIGRECPHTKQFVGFCCSGATSCLRSRLLRRRRSRGYSVSYGKQVRRRPNVRHAGTETSHGATS